jgi:uncharacterized membrane protein
MSTPPENLPAVEAETPPAPLAPSLLTIANAVYALQAIGVIVTPAFIVAVVLNYVKRDDVRGTLLESHFRWQIRTFWFGLLWAVVGVLTMVILIGFVILFANFVWVIYRIVKGWLDLLDRKPMYRNAAI